MKKQFISIKHCVREWEESYNRRRLMRLGCETIKEISKALDSKNDFYKTYQNAVLK